MRSTFMPAAVGDWGEIFISFVRDLEQFPSKVVIPLPLSFETNNIDPPLVLNNVPTPDYESQGGFVGREEDIKKVTSLLEGDLHRVVTISGAGGVGKTALAQKVVRNILKKQNQKFDGIVWLSAKETRLSYLGIEDIEPTLKNYEELLDTIFDVMNFSNPKEKVEEKEEEVKTIFEIYRCVLIVIDNLETITDERIRDFILDSHKKTKVLITSRKGLGQVERRHELKQLKEKEAIYLFRQIAREKNLNSLVSLDDPTIRCYVGKVSYYPLAIKWMIGQVAIGKDVNNVVSAIKDTTSDISHFCFDQIYKDLTSCAKKILCALSCFDEPPSAGVLKYVVDIDQKDFEDGIHDLILVSLVIPESQKDAQNNLSTRYVLLSLTRGYVRRQLDKETILKRDMEERLRNVHITIEEAERAAKQYRYSLHNLGASTEEEKIAAMIAQTAFQKYSAGRYEDASEDYKRAIKIAPNFASLYRNWAVMEAQEGHFVESDDLMKKAAQLNPSDAQIWLTWGNIKRKADKVKDALSYYEKAHSLSSEDSVIMNALGQAKCRLGDYSKAHDLFLRALSAKEDSVRHKIVNYSSLADNLARWAESLINDRNSKLGESKLEEALKYCELTLNLNREDTKSSDLYRKILIKSGHVYKNSQPVKAINLFLKAIVDKSFRYMRYTEARDTLEATFQAVKLFYRLGDTDKAKELLSVEITKNAKLKNDTVFQKDVQSLYQALHHNRGILNGKIIRVDFQRKFTIIESTVANGSTYFGHFKDFLPNFDGLESLDGKQVTFIPNEDQTSVNIKKMQNS